MHFRNVKKFAGDVYISSALDGEAEGNTMMLIDTCSDEDSLIDDIDLKMKSEQLYKFIDQVLETRERMIIKLRYGLDGITPLTQREIATKLKISRSYVSRIEKKALLALRKEFERGMKV